MTSRELEAVFTASDKDVLSVDDFRRLTGLSKTYCYQLINDIKKTSDVLKIKGKVHRVDYYEYIKRLKIKDKEKGIAKDEDNE